MERYLGYVKSRKSGPHQPSSSSAESCQLLLQSRTFQCIQSLNLKALSSSLVMNRGGPIRIPKELQFQFTGWFMKWKNRLIGWNHGSKFLCMGNQLTSSHETAASISFFIVRCAWRRQPAGIMETGRGKTTTGEGRKGGRYRWGRGWGNANGTVQTGW